MAVPIGSGSKEELTYRDVINITTNPPAQRVKKDVLAVSDWITKRTTLFADMDKDIVYNVMKNCKCQVMLRDTVVVRQGDKGDAFYIILHGQVSVFVKEVVETKKSLLSELLESDEEPDKSPTPEPLSEHEENEEEPPKPTGPSVRQRFRKTLTKLKITQQITTKMKKKPAIKKPNPRDSLGQRVAEMGDGKAFGELALLNSDNKRAASCVTESDVVFLVVGRDLYNKSIKSFQARQLALIRGFVTRHPFFAHWPSKMQSQVLNSVIQIKLQPGETVLRQGQAYNGIYFLIQGEVKVTINSENHSKQYTDTTNSGETQQLDDDSSQHRLLGHCEILRSLSVPNVHVRRRGGYAAAEHFQSNKHRDLCLSGPTIMFGDIEHILGVNTYIQTISAESSTRLFHINKENWDRLLRLASNIGHTVSNPTITAMTEMAYMTWKSRLEKFTTTLEELSSLDSMIRELLNQPTMRVKSASQVPLSKEEKLFESLLTAYLTDQAPLIQPCVEGGHYYRSLMQERAALRKKHQARRGNVKPPRSLRPLRNSRIPRSRATLREQIKKYNTSDVDILVPPTKRKSELDPIRPIDSKVKDTGKHPAPYTYGRPTVEQRASTVPIVTPAVPMPAKREYISSTELQPLTDKDVNMWPRALEHIPEQDENEAVTKAPITIEPVLITEKLHKCDSFDLVEGKTLKFYSQYLRGRLEEEYNRPLIDPEVVQNNRDAELLEQKLHQFLDPDNSLPDSTTAICKLHRLDESKKTSLLPGGKCMIERTPCRLLRKSFPLKAHEHTRRHIVEN